MKKTMLFCLLALFSVSLSFAQIYRGEGDGKNGTVAFSLYFVEYTDFRYLLNIGGVSVFLDDDNITKLKAVLEKFGVWETLAAGEQISLTKTIDSITFKSFHFNRTFFKEPVIFYFVFSGGPLETAGGAVSGGKTPEYPAGNQGSSPAVRYTLFIDTTLEQIPQFRLSSKTVQELLGTLAPEKLAEARKAYERQKALEERFN
jgi:hypothetical protein